MKQNNHLAGHLSAFFTIFIWGTTYISTKVLLKSFAPIEILVIRFVLGYAALFIAYPHKLKFNSWKQEGVFMCAGLSGITFYYLLENIALTYTMASNVGIIISIAPLVTAVFAYFFLKGDKLKTNFIIGFVAAMIGIFLISFNGNTVFKLNPLGDFLAAMAALVWAAYSIFAKKISSYGYPTIATTRRTFFYGLIFMLPFLMFYDINLDFNRFKDPTNLYNLLFLSFAASALCFVTWNFSVKILGAVKTSIYIYLSPVITVVTSIIILHERITSLAALGTVLTLLGLVISGNDIRLKKKVTQPEVNNIISS